MSNCNPVAGTQSQLMSSDVTQMIKGFTVLAEKFMFIQNHRLVLKNPDMYILGNNWIDCITCLNQDIEHLSV